MKSKKKIRVMFFLPALGAGGAERVALTLLRNLPRDRFDISLIIVNRGWSALSGDLPSDIEIIDLASSRLRFSLGKFLHLLWKVRPDIVFSTIDYLNVTLGAIRLFWPRQIRFVARPTILFSADLKTRRRPTAWRLLSKVALSNTDLMVFQSSAMEKDYREALEWHDGPATVIHNPIDFSLVSERANRMSDAGFSPDRFNLVAAGRLESQKGFDVAIEAVALTQDKSITLTILGEGSMRDRLEQLIRQHKVQDRVSLLGYIQNPYPYFAKADGFLLSSRFEGFPNVVLESLACGTPVVATPVAGLGPILENIPECRLSADYRPISIAEAMDQLALHGRRRVNSDVIKHFDVNHIVGQYEKMFMDVVALSHEHEQARQFA